MPDSSFAISIVTTLYRSAPYIREFYERISAEARKLTESYEIVFVNDGSPDESLDTAVSLHEKDEKVKVIDLSRNFGHHKAIMTGLEHAKGELVFLIDCDLEEEPELLGGFHSKMKETRADVVYGVQGKRKGGMFERASGHVFYWFFNRFSSYPIPHNQITARLMTKRYVESLVQHKDREVFLDGLWAITGYGQVPVAVTKYSKGSSTYTMRRKLSMFVNAVTSFSSKPLVFIFYLGLLITLVSVGAALYLISRRLFFDTYLSGWPSLIVSVWILGGLTIFCLGVIGIYLSKVFMETKDRPCTVVREIYERTAEQQ